VNALRIILPSTLGQCYTPINKISGVVELGEEPLGYYNAASPYEEVGLPQEARKLEVILTWPRNSTSDTDIRGQYASGTVIGNPAELKVTYSCQRVKADELKCGIAHRVTVRWGRDVAVVYAHGMVFGYIPTALPTTDLWPLRFLWSHFPLE
jgi:hypothetical protein